jgi:hypothetical protein
MARTRSKAKKLMGVGGAHPSLDCEKKSMGVGAAIPSTESDLSKLMGVGEANDLSDSEKTKSMADDANPSTGLTEKMKLMGVGDANTSIDDATMKPTGDDNATASSDSGKIKVTGVGDTNFTKDSNTDTVSAFDFISKARQAALSKLQTSPTDDGVELNQIFHATQVLIASNQVTWGRCKGVMHASSSDTMTFTRFGCIRVTAVTGHAVHPPSLILQFETTPEYSSKEFGFPDPLPKDLQIFDLSKDGVFPDYKSLLEASALLQDDLLISFLVKLK